MGLLSKKRAPEWVRVAAESDFAHTLQVRYDNRDFALFKTEAGIFCSQPSCSHEYSPLVEGIIEGTAVHCEKHGSRFDLQSGRVLDLPASTDLVMYPVRIENGEIWIKV